MFFFSVGCLGELFPLVADPVQPDFHQFITLQAVCTGRQGGWCHLHAKPTKLYDTSFSGEIEIVPKNTAKLYGDALVYTAIFII